MSTMFKERQQKQNAANAQEIALNLQEKEEIDNKISYYKSLLKAYGEHVDSIDDKIARLKEEKSERYEVTKLEIEKVQLLDVIENKKAFFEMWLKRLKDYEEKFEILTKECNENFDKVEAQAKELAKTNMLLQSFITKYDQEENKDQKIKNEYYLLLKYNVMKFTGKGEFNLQNQK